MAAASEGAAARTSGAGIRGSSLARPLAAVVGTGVVGAAARLDLAGLPAAVGAADRRLDARAGPQPREAGPLEARRADDEHGERAALAVAQAEAPRVAVDREHAA